jgi:hypothetical protein
MLFPSRLCLLLGLGLFVSACQPHHNDGVPPASPAAPVLKAPGVTAADSALAVLPARHVGRFPEESGLWAEPAVSSRLSALLGAKLKTFFGCMELKSPIGLEGNVLYVTGSNLRDRTYAAVFAMDLASGGIFVRLRERGVDHDYQQAGANFKLPRQVQAFSAHWAQWPESVALAAGHPQVPDLGAGAAASSSIIEQGRRRRHQSVKE